MFAMSFGMAIFADKMLPRSRTGNCWSYAIPKWLKEGGYLLVRPADGQRVFGHFHVWHCIWVKNICRWGGLESEQFVPPKRKRSRFAPWYTIYYEGEVRTSEKPHPSSTTDWGDLPGGECAADALRKEIRLAKKS